jgi:hypothetical protein
MPARSKKKEPADEKPLVCAMPGCKDPPLDGDDFCAVHVFIFPVVESAQKTIRKGGLENIVKGALTGLGASLGESLLQAGKLAIGRYGAAATGPGPTGPIPNPFAGFRAQRMQQKDPYAVLGLKPTATVDEIRARQRKFATLFHADRLGNDPELAKLAEGKLKEINEAAALALKNAKRG